MRGWTLVPFGMLIAGLAGGCSNPSDLPTAAPAAALDFAAPSTDPPGELATISLGGAAQRIWPFLSATLSSPDDPVNLLFTGRADPRAIRSALLGLDGQRGAVGFPAGRPFDCTWSDAIGGLQGAYTEAAGWSGSAIQLQCGGFGPVRFHLRLFRLGDLTLGGAHFEVLIPGTTDHQVLSWELAEQLVTADLARSGLLGAAPGATGMISPAPYREIPDLIYSGLPDGLKQLAGGPSVPVSSPVPIQTDGRATILALAGEPAPAPGSGQRLVIQFAQVIPRPFCTNSEDALVLIQGPVTLEKTVRITDGGTLETTYHASGMLQVAAIDPASGEVLGDPYQAKVEDQQAAFLSGDRSWVRGVLLQIELPESEDHGWLRETLTVGGGGTGYDKRVNCGPRP